MLRQVLVHWDFHTAGPDTGDHRDLFPAAVAQVCWALGTVPPLDLGKSLETTRDLPDHLAQTLYRNTTRWGVSRD